MGTADSQVKCYNDLLYLIFPIGLYQIRRYCSLREHLFLFSLLKTG